MNMKIRKILRDFINWQGANNLLKDELTIDYEVAETYLEENPKVNNSVINGIQNWVEYDWLNVDSRPPVPGRYLIYRKKCNKIHFEQWNGSGWSSSNNDCTHWTIIFAPDSY